MASLRRRQPEPPAWTNPPGLTVGPVPPAVVALVQSGALPDGVAACVGADGPNWLDVADAIDGLLRDLPPGAEVAGALYAMGAYAHLASSLIMVDEMRERAGRAEELLDRAHAAGVRADGLETLYPWIETLQQTGAEAEQESAGLTELDPDTLHGSRLADRAFDLANSPDPALVRLGAGLYDRLAQERADDPDEVLDARCRQAIALYDAGDRDAALALLRGLAEPPSRPAQTMLPTVRSLLVTDAANHEGPVAARRVWRRMRAVDAGWPPPGVQEHLVTTLLGAGVPDLLAELGALLRPRADTELSARQALARLAAVPPT